MTTDIVPADGGVSTATNGRAQAQDGDRADVEATLAGLKTSRDGLAAAEAGRRLAETGPNAIPEEHHSMLAELASYFWGPIPWMIEVALILSAVLRHWADVIIVGVLLAFNAGVGFWQEHTAADAVAALKRQLAPRAAVRRDGAWTEIDAAGLVPGDVVRIHLGDVVPADVVLLDGEYLRVDQSALTGESLPADKGQEDVAYSGSVAVQGSMTAVVTATGEATYFGKTTKLVAAAQPKSHFQRAVLTIGDYLIWLSLALVVLLVVVEVFRGAAILTLVQFALILTVAAIPVAMPAVLSVTMAVGAVVLSKMKAIVTRLESIEEMAGIDVLCSDKTGTLTENKLTLAAPATVGDTRPDQVILAAALASEPGSTDAIDRAVLAAAGGQHALEDYRQTRFVPFDPVSKRTEADVTRDGATFTVTKGAPQVVIGLCEHDLASDGDRSALRHATDTVAQLAARGYRTLGVARRKEGGPWRLLGLLPLTDPPRPDSADTIRRAGEHGLAVKMLTGDNTAIATEIAAEVGLGARIEPARQILAGGSDGQPGEDAAERIESLDGFAEVFPEHKYQIVKALQARGHIVGMTGDGVNDAPALKQADAGIAVAGATDAARAAADLVLTAPGLSVIVAAIEQARKIFERMNSYAIYRVTETIRIVLFVVAAMLAFNFYPITAILIILLALFNDLPIMTIAVDNTPLDPQPVRWDMRRVLTLSTVLGMIGVIATFGILALAKLWLHLDIAQIETLIFLKLAVAGHLTLFIARSRGPFWARPWPAPAMIWSAVGTKVLATLLVAFGIGLITPISWPLIGLTWAYAIAWLFITDLAKLAVYRHLSHSGRRHQRFLTLLQEDLRLGSRAARLLRGYTMGTTDQELLSGAELDGIDAWWRAANYLSVGQIYLMGNPLLAEPLRPEHVKPRLLGHFGTTPGLNLIYAHLNRVIRNWDLNVIYVCGPGHGGPGMVANAYLEGTYSELYPAVTQDAAGMARLCRQFSFPGGIPSHAAPETPGSIHEGGELGYSVAHAYGAAFDNPDLIVACVIGDGEAETGPLAGSWHSNKFLNPVTDGAVLPILHLNGYKIANPTVLARIPAHELESLLHGYGYAVHVVEGDDPKLVHQQLAATMDAVVGEIQAIQRRARVDGDLSRPAWPAIVLKTPKGWTGPKEVDGLPVEGTWRAHQVPIPEARTNPEHLAQLEAWLRSYHPEELFASSGTLVDEVAQLAPRDYRRMSANPNANGGLLLRELRLPDFRDYAVTVGEPGTGTAEGTRVLGGFLRDVIKANPSNFRLFGPDETESNRLTDVYQVTNKAFEASIVPGDNHLAPDGRVVEVLSEHMCEGWLEGYLLTGRHGLFNCYEAFIHIVDSMFNQHAKWLKVSREISWRRPVASLNYLLSSLVWRQDHNGFSHQDPGFIDHVVNKKASVVRVYLPPDANCLLSTADHCLRSRNYVNVIVADKQPQLQWLAMEDAIIHCTRGAGIWEWASNDAPGVPDVVMACCGDIPTLEVLAAVSLLRVHLPELKVRVVNVVDLMRLEPATEHPHGMSDAEFDALFTVDRPVIFGYHGYPWLIHRLTYRRHGHSNFHVRGYKEEGTTTTPFDMVMLNDLDRFHLVMDVIDRVPGLSSSAGHVRQLMTDKRLTCRAYTREHGEDAPEITGWTWPS